MSQWIISRNRSIEKIFFCDSLREADRLKKYFFGGPLRGTDRLKKIFFRWTTLRNRSIEKMFFSDSLRETDRLRKYFFSDSLQRIDRLKCLKKGRARVQKITRCFFKRRLPHRNQRDHDGGNANDCCVRKIS